MIHQTLVTWCFQASSSASKTLPSSNSASPARAIIRPGGSRSLTSCFLRRNSWASAAKLVMATPMPTDPVEMSTSSRSFVREGYDCAPPNARKRSSCSRVCLPSRYWTAWKTGLPCGFTATRSWGRRTSK